MPKFKNGSEYWDTYHTSFDYKKDKKLDIGEWHEPVKKPKLVEKLMNEEFPILDFDENEKEEEMPTLLSNYFNDLKLPLKGEWFEKKFGEYRSHTLD